MSEIVAKPIVKDQYWVITDGDKKIGNVIANGSGFDVKMNGSQTHYKTTTELKRTTKIEFQTLKSNKTKIQLPFANYPTTGKIYNSILDIKRKLHIYTKTPKSKCFHAAGWFVLNHTGEDEVVFCPKYIFIQRYPYVGPFKTKLDAEQQINTQ